MLRPLATIVILAAVIVGPVIACGGSNAKRADGSSAVLAGSGPGCANKAKMAATDCPPCPPCPGDTHKSASVQAAPTAVVPVANQVKSEDGKVIVKDVVSGNMITVKAETPYTDYQGQRYYFECNGCKASFLEQPDKFMDKQKS